MQTAHGTQEGTKGVIIAGSYGELIIREKTGERLELGELLVAHTPTGQGNALLVQVTDLLYGSQISQQHRELLSGLAIEDGVALEFADEHLRSYTLAVCKPLLTLPNMTSPKGIPPAFTPLRAVTAADLHFESPEHAVYLGTLRSGSKELPLPIFINGRELLTHHVLVAATTGRGKSNLMKVLLQDLAEKEFASVLVFDPHAEYASALGSKRLAVYTKDASAGEFSLRINLTSLKPAHFDGAVDLTDAQRDALRVYYRKYGAAWIEHIMLDETPVSGTMEGTFLVLKRKLGLVLSLEQDSGGLVCSSVFDRHAGAGTIDDISRRLISGGMVVVETASLTDAAEVLVANLLTAEAYERWKRERPAKVLSVCLEEAPRFIGDDVLKQGPNVFSQIAREGRKFGVGLIAITQLPSLIPRQVLANMNTKIILGIEMAPERQAVMESASQDLSRDGRIIASLEKGEAIVTSTFTRFAIPLKIPLFRKKQKEEGSKDRIVAGLKKP